MSMAALLRQSCTIARAAVSAGDDLDLLLGATAQVASLVPCLFAPIKVSSDMQAVGPLEKDIQQLFLLPDQDLRRHDVVTDADGVEWIVDGVPQVFKLRGVGHHLEVLVVKKGVQ